MYKFPPKLTKLTYLCVVLALVFALGACTTDNQGGVLVPPGEQSAPATGGQAPSQAQQQPSTPGGTFSGVMEAPEALHTASSLLDYNFESRNGEVTGTIDDFLIDMQSGRIRYAILEHGGVLDIGDSEFAVPIHAFTWGNDGQLFIDIDQQSLESYPELGADWPNFDDQGWDDNLNDFWANLGFGDNADMDADTNEQASSVVRLSNLMDMNTADLGSGAGSVEDILIDLQQGLAKFVVLDFGDWFGENELVAVPFDAFDAQSVRGDELVFTPDFDSAVLESAPRFQRDMIAEGGALEPTFDDDVEAYWQDHGLLGSTAFGDGTTGAGQTPATTTGTTATGAMATGNAGVTGAQNALISASTLLDYDFQNIDGQVSGEIEDFLVDINTGRILYVTLEYGGFLEIGDTELPVPLSVFTLGDGNSLVLNIPEETLDALPDLGEDWADPINTTWDDEVNNFWLGEGFDPGFDVTDTSGPTMWGSELIDTYGVTDAGFGASDVVDLLIDLEQGHVRYAVLDFDDAGTFGANFGDELAIVPFEAMNMTAAGEDFGFDENFDATVIENAPRIADPAILREPTLFDPSYADQFDRYWEDQGFLARSGTNSAN